MKKYLLISILSLFLVIVWGGQVFAQNPEVAAKPSFINLIPGQYVHGWPAFTVSYPKEWVEQRYQGGEAFRVADPDSKTVPRVPNFVIPVVLTRLPIENWSNIFIPFFSRIGRDVKIIYDKPSELKDGTPAQEGEFEWVRMDGLKMNMFVFNTSKDDIWITIMIASDKGKIGEDMKNYAHSLTFLKGREEPVKVPSDVQEFLDKFCSATMSGDVERIMAHFSDQYLNSGLRKANYEQWFRNDPASPVNRAVTSSEATVTVFEAHGDKAYLDGFFSGKGRDDPKPMKVPILYRQIVKEGGQWKWYGNQK